MIWEATKKLSVEETVYSHIPYARRLKDKGIK